MAFEDLELTDRLRALCAPSVLGPPLQTSARRWEGEGVTRTILRMWLLRAGYRLGLDPARVARGYRSHPRATPGASR